MTAERDTGLIDHRFVDGACDQGRKFSILAPGHCALQRVQYRARIRWVGLAGDNFVFETLRQNSQCSGRLRRRGALWIVRDELERDRQRAGARCQYRRVADRYDFERPRFLGELRANVWSDTGRFSRG